MLGHDGHASFPFRKDQEPAGGFKTDESLLFLSRTAIPALIADGVSQDAVDLMMRESPRRFLTGEG
jgi:phosphotriesterase-related protein